MIALEPVETFDGHSRIVKDGRAGWDQRIYEQLCRNEQLSRPLDRVDTGSSPVEKSRESDPAFLGVEPEKPVGDITGGRAGGLRQGINGRPYRETDEVCEHFGHSFTANPDVTRGCEECKEEREGRKGSPRVEMADIDGLKRVEDDAEREVKSWSELKQAVVYMFMNSSGIMSLTKAKSIIAKARGD